VIIHFGLSKKKKEKQDEEEKSMASFETIISKVLRTSSRRSFGSPIEISVLTL
jgi:hypothetical protein